VIDHTIRQVALLMLLWFEAYVVARLVVNYFSKKRTVSDNQKEMDSR
jgi:hypothetical protein